MRLQAAKEAAEARAQLAGNDTVFAAMERIARDDPEWRVREAVAGSLAKIGDEKATDLLMYMVRTDPHPCPAETALRMLGEFAAPTWFKERGAGEPRSPGVIRTRGSAQGRGASVSRQLGPKMEAVWELIDQVRSNHPDALVRQTAGEILGRLSK